MGFRVTEPPRRVPPRHRTAKCPTCGHPRRGVVNGAWLRYQRLRRGLSQREAGRQMGASSPYLSDLESNRRECPFSLEVAYTQLKAPRG